MEKKKEPKKKEPKNLKGNFAKGIIFWLLLGIFLFTLLKFSNLEEKTQKKISDNEFFQGVESGEISGVVTIKGSTQATGKFISGKFKNGTRFSTYTEDPEVYEFLKAKPYIKIHSQAETKSVWLNLLYSVLPIVLIFGFLWFFIARQVAKGGDKVLSFGKSRIKPLSESKQKITFADVAGLKEAKEELKEIIEFLKDPKKFQKLGGKIPKGVLLIGPPGTGKTLLAKAVSGEAGVPFLSMSGSDFVEMFVGVGAARVRDLFQQAKKNAPAIVFIDEIDAVGRQRFAGLGGGHDEREQTLNQLLVEMDGFSTEEGVILMAASNRPDVLDPALVRRGRFDRQVVVTWPDIKEREEILKVHTKEIKLHPKVDLKVVARGTPGLSGADLANLANEAALLGSRKNKESVEMDDFEEAKDKVMMGVEKKSLLISEKEKKIIAYHEAGHTLVQKFMPEANPIHKVTIIPRGQALGLTHILPEKDTYIESNIFYQGELATLLGGRSAELFIFAKSYTGAENDLQIATELARKMVCEWGMSEKLGPIAYRKRPSEVFLGRDLVQSGEHSEATSREIDQEVKRLIEEAQKKAKEILEKNREKLEKIARTLLEKETLTGEEVDKIVNGLKEKPQNEQEKDRGSSQNLS